MRMRLSFISLVLVVSVVFPAPAVFSQSLVIKKQDDKYWIQASAPADTPHTLQVSDNLHLWVDIQQNVTDPYSLALDDAGVLERYFRFTPSAPAPPPIRVMIVGDSMSADCCGWGRGIYPYFNANATVVNY